MLSFAGSVRVFLAVEPADMRKGFEGLHALVGERLREEVRSGALFVFTNQRHTRLKVLYFDGSGLWLMTKRLEKGTFAWPKVEEIGAPKLALRPEALAMLVFPRKSGRVERSDLFGYYSGNETDGNQAA